jgi:hypothetical protein
VKPVGIALGLAIGGMPVSSIVLATGGMPMSSIGLATGGMPMSFCRFWLQV